MSDVRLVGTSPEDGSLVPVAVTPAGLLKTQVGTIEEIPNDLRIDGDLTVTGTINGDQGGGGLPSPIGSDGEVLTVVDGDAAWAAPSGAPGPPGPEGPAGGAFPLPADPYEGALLGWLNGELAWVGSPPIVIPEGIYGAITDWNSIDGVLTLENPADASVTTGVYIEQCFLDGEPAGESDFINIQQEWTTLVSSSGFHASYGRNLIFDGDINTGALNSGSFTIDGLALGDVAELKIFFANGASDNSTLTASLNDGPAESLLGNNTSFRTNPLVFENVQGLNKITIGKQDGTYAGLAQIQADGRVLLDRSLGVVQARVNNRLSDTQLLVVPSTGKDFRAGTYIKVNQQRLAPWLRRTGSGKRGMLELP